MCANLTTNYENYKGFFYYSTVPMFTYIKKSNDGKTISWYYENSSSSANQFNLTTSDYDYRYHVLAIGHKEES